MRFTIDIIQGLQYLHSQRPSGREVPKPKILKAGLRLSRDIRMNRQNNLSGSPNKSADVFLYGCLLVFMFARLFPFEVGQQQWDAPRFWLGHLTHANTELATLFFAMGP